MLKTSCPEHFKKCKRFGQRIRLSDDLQIGVGKYAHALRRCRPIYGVERKGLAAALRLVQISDLRLTAANGVEEQGTLLRQIVEQCDDGDTAVFLVLLLHDLLQDLKTVKNTLAHGKYHIIRTHLHYVLELSVPRYIVFDFAL